MRDLARQESGFLKQKGGENMNKSLKELLLPEILDTETKEQKYEKYVEAGIRARIQMERCQWTLGDLALEVEKCKGGRGNIGNLRKYADDIDIEYETLVQYRRVSKIFKPCERSQALNWTHHLLCTTTDNPLDWLKKAETKSWSTKTLKQEISTESLRGYGHGKERGKVWGKKEHILGESGTGIPYYINYYCGCVHACKFCYGCTFAELGRLGKIGNRLPNYGDWKNPKLVDNWKETLEKDLKSRTMHREVFVQSISDSYMPGVDPSITRAALELLEEYKYPIFLITKNTAITRDLDFFKRYRHNLRIGHTIITLDERISKEVEPYASPINKRLEVLGELYNAGLYTVVSLEPLLPGINIDQIKELIDATHPYTHEYIFVGMLNYKSIPKEFRNFHLWKNIGKGAYNQFYIDLFKELFPYLKKKYTVAEHTKGFLDQNKIKH